MKTELGIPTLYLVAGLASSARVWLGESLVEPLKSIVKFWTRPRLRNKSLSSETDSEITEKLSLVEVSCWN